MSGSERVEPARRRGLAHEVADRLREEIFAGTYPPGGHLPELELSGALEVSRGPVREALRMLESEGLVRVIWHRGARVTTLTPPDILELDTLRGALEDLAVRQVVRRAKADDFAAIDKAADAMLRSLNSHELVYADIVFHDAVFDASHHRRLIEAWQGIRRQVHLFLLTRIGQRTEDYLDRMPSEHHQLAKVLRARDEETALSMFAAHRGKAFEVLIGPTQS